MASRDLVRSSKGLMQRVENMIRATLPRQAFVTGDIGDNVLVRFVGEESDSPESQFPSTVSGIAVGSKGWVITLGGKKGLFVAAGVPKPDANSGGASSQPAISTSGDYPIAAAAATVSGLVPGSVRKVVGTVVFRATGTSAQAHMAFQMVDSTTSGLFSPGATPISSGTYTFTYPATRTVGPDGKLSVVPCVRWAAGTINVQAIYATIQVL